MVAWFHTLSFLWPIKIVHYVYIGMQQAARLMPHSATLYNYFWIFVLFFRHLIDTYFFCIFFFLSSRFVSSFAIESQ